MDCRECSLCLDALIRDELSEEEKEKALYHLSQCESCKKEYDDAVLIKKGFDTLVEKNDRSLADSVIAEIRKETTPYRKTPFLIRHMGLAASLVFILVLAVYTGVSEVRKDHSDMYISEMEASVTDADGSHFVADLKNNAILESDTESFPTDSFVGGTMSKKEPFLDETEDDVYYFCSDSINGTPIVPEEAPAPEPEASKGDTTEEDSFIKIMINENFDDILSALSDFEIIEKGENYIIINANDYEEVEKIIEEKKKRG